MSGHETCHCGRALHYGYDGNPDHTRGMCADCDASRCDADPTDCPYRREVAAQDDSGGRVDAWADVDLAGLRAATEGSDSEDSWYGAAGEVIIALAARVEAAEAQVRRVRNLTQEWREGRHATSAVYETAYEIAQIVDAVMDGDQ